MTTLLDKVDTAMAEAVAEVCESSVFTQAAPGPTDSFFAATGPVFHTRLAVYRPTPGTVGLVVPRPLAQQLAATMLPQDGTDDEDDFIVMDVLSELTNMLAGSFLTHLLAGDDSFTLGLPECRIVTPSDGDGEWDEAKTFVFELDAQPFLVTWRCH